jgi:hypothetical protein
VNGVSWDDLAQMWEAADPVPEGLVARMQAVAAAEAELVESDFDYELMLLVERSAELAGTRGSAAYTLRFAYDDVDLLVRAAGDSDTPVARLDGWIVPPGEITVRAQLVNRDDTSYEWESVVDGHGRFEFRDLPTGMVRLWLMPGGGARPFATPTFEI